MERFAERMTNPLPFRSRTPADYRGLPFWMKKALEELNDLNAELTDHNVHGLRVALRRCRSLATAMEEVDPHPDWEIMRSTARKLFRALGELRDTHVITNWLNRLHPLDDPLKNRMLENLAITEKSARIKARRRALRFDKKLWKKLSHSLAARARRVPLDGAAAHCLALERLEEAHDLHRRAMRTESIKPWHASRIGIKHFRYTVEFLLPTAHARWEESLKQVQELLGNIHDLDVLAEMSRKANTALSTETSTDWKSIIANERHKNSENYRKMALGTTSVWSDWMAEFPHANWDRYSNARISVTRATLDPKPARSMLITRLALRLWSQLRTLKIDPHFADKKQRRILETAARLSGLSAPGTRKARGKFARNFLLKSPVPPGWSFVEWELVAWSIRFQQGVDPSYRHKRFSRLLADQQEQICLFAGILRLAFALQKAGAPVASALRVQELPQGLLIKIDGVEDSPKNAARFAKAKKLLERSLRKTILIQPESTVLQLPAIVPDVESSVAISVAS
jgi:CHAD domain-containing protein